MAYGTIAADVITGTNGNSFSPESSVFRNRIINGAMVIDQRNAGASVTQSNGGALYPVDRFAIYGNAASNKFTAQQNAGSVTPPAGFKNYLGITSSAATSLAAGDYYRVYQSIEGLNLYDIGYGTANAKTMTLSFQVYSSLTGSFGGSIYNSSANKSYPFSYTISSANTWTTINVTFAGDTASAIATDNTTGFLITWGLGVGSTWSGTAGAWASGNIMAPSSSVSVVGTNGATLYITGVQLEVGSQATSFDYRQYGTELALCQRYFTKSFATTTAPANSSAAPYEGVGASFINGYFSSNFVAFPATMRSVPTLTYYSSANGTPSNGVWQIYDGGWANASSLNGSNITVNGFQNSWVYSSATVKGAYYISGHFIASAEL